MTTANHNKCAAERYPLPT